MEVLIQRLGSRFHRHYLKRHQVQQMQALVNFLQFRWEYRGEGAHLSPRSILDKDLVMEVFLNSDIIKISFLHFPLVGT